MRFFVCSDVHGNARALDAVLSLLRRESPIEFLFLGDCVGYGSHPDACLDRILRLPRAHLLMGNHEQALLSRRDRAELNEIAAETLTWSERMMNGRYDDVFGDRFEDTYRKGNLLAAHATPVDPGSWHYVFTTLDADYIFSNEDFFVCFVGHTHLPAMFTQRRGEVPLPVGREIELEPGDRYIVNPGSVGQPRDGDPRAACCVYDSKSRKLVLYRCEYDAGAEADDILEAGLPALLAYRLRSGV